MLVIHDIYIHHRVLVYLLFFKYGTHIFSLLYICIFEIMTLYFSFSSLPFKSY